MTAPRRGAPTGALSPALRHVPLFLTGLAALALCAALSLVLGARSVHPSPPWRTPCSATPMGARRWW
ncbi:hypothetical protein ACQ4WX_06485 [Streptomyces lasalocidi]